MQAASRLSGWDMVSKGEWHFIPGFPWPPCVAAAAAGQQLFVPVRLCCWNRNGFGSAGELGIILAACMHVLHAYSK